MTRQRWNTVVEDRMRSLSHSVNPHINSRGYTIFTVVLRSQPHSGISNIFVARDEFESYYGKR